MDTKPDAFDRKLRIARLFMAADVFLRQAALVVTVAGLFALVGILSQRLVAAPVVVPWVCWVLGLCAAATIAYRWWTRRPSQMDAALAIDTRLGLRERFSTAISLADVDNQFARASVQEAHMRAADIQLKPHFPIRPSKAWAYGLTIWIAVVAVFVFVPSMDLLGSDAERETRKSAKDKQQKAASDAKKAVASVKAVVSQLGDDSLTEQAGDIAKALDLLKPSDLRRQVIRKLGDLSRSVNDHSRRKGFGAKDNFNSKMRKLRSGKGDQARKMINALARGDYKTAAAEARKLAEKLAGGKLTKAEREALAKQLQALAKQLDKISKDQKELSDTLAKAGLSKDAAKMGDSQLRKALREQGLSEEKINKIMDKVRDAQRASEMCEKLGDAAADCAKDGDDVSPEDLEGLADQLSRLEGMVQDMEIAQAALDEIARAADSMGEEDEDDMEAEGGDGDGDGNGNGDGMGRGRGLGARPTGDPEDTSSERKRVKNARKAGPAIASWEFRGRHAKGQASRELKIVVTAAKEQAADAIGDNRIPRRYEASVKKYFSQLEAEAKKRSDGD